METKFKVGFIVEGSFDRLVVEAIARRVLPPETILHSVRLGGKIAYSTPQSTVVIFRDRDYAHVVLVGDSDCPPGEKADHEQSHVENMMRSHHFTPDVVSVCLAVPTIETWLLAQYDANPEMHPNAKKALEEREGQRLDEAVVTRLATELDIPLARSRSASLDRFVTVLERLKATRQVHASAA